MQMIAVPGLFSDGSCATHTQYTSCKYALSSFSMLSFKTVFPDILRTENVGGISFDPSPVKSSHCKGF